MAHRIKTQSARAAREARRKARVVAGMRMGAGPVMVSGGVARRVDAHPASKTLGAITLSDQGLGAHKQNVANTWVAKGAHALVPLSGPGRTGHALGALITRSQGYGHHVQKTYMGTQGNGSHAYASLGDDAMAAYVQQQVSAWRNSLPDAQFYTQINQAYSAMVSQLPPYGQTISKAQFGQLIYRVSDFINFIPTRAIPAIEQASGKEIGQALLDGLYVTGASIAAGPGGTAAAWAATAATGDSGPTQNDMVGAVLPSLALYEQWCNTYLPMWRNLAGQPDTTAVNVGNFTLDSINVLSTAVTGLTVMYSLTSDLGAWQSIGQGLYNTATTFVNVVGKLADTAGKVVDIAQNILDSLKNLSDAARKGTNFLSDITPVLVVGGLAFLAWHLLGRPMPRSMK